MIQLRLQGLIPRKQVLAWHTESVHGGPAVDFVYFGAPKKLSRDERQHTADNNALHDVSDIDSRD